MSSESVDGLEFDHVLLVVIDKDEPCRSMTTEGGSESIENNVFGINSILFGNKFLEIILGDVGLSLVEDIEENFLPGQNLIYPEPSCSDGNGHN